MDNPLSLKSARTLTIQYNLPISKTANFWEELKKGKVFTTKCKKCDVLHFPPVADCGACGSSDIEWTELSGEGKLVTYTEVLVKPASFSKEAPYIVAICQLKEGIKVLAWMHGIKREQIKIGMNVKLVPKIFSDKRVSYEFVSV